MLSVTPAIVTRRPAETATGAVGALVGLLALIFHWDGQVVAYLTILVAAVPSAITWLVNTIRGEGGQSVLVVIVGVVLAVLLLRLLGVW